MIHPHVRKCAVLVRFRRKARADWEYGVGIGDDVADLDTIIDTEGKPVETCYDFQHRTEVGFMWFDVPIVSVRKTIREVKLK